MPFRTMVLRLYELDFFTRRHSFFCNGRTADAFHISRILIKLCKITVFGLCTYVELSDSMSRVCNGVFILHVYVFFRYKYAILGLRACVGNYQKISNTNVVASYPPIYKSKGRQYFNAITSTLYSVRRIRTSITK